MNIQAGTIFGYRALGDFGSFADGLGAVYYFGRSKREDFRQPQLIVNRQLQKEMIPRHCSRCSGLNRPAQMLLWEVTFFDVEQLWGRIKDNLRGNIWAPYQGRRPVITQQLQLGDNWYTVSNMGPQEFRMWVQSVAVRERGELDRIRRLALPVVLIQGEPDPEPEQGEPGAPGQPGQPEPESEMSEDEENYSDLDFELHINIVRDAEGREMYRVAEDVIPVPVG